MARDADNVGMSALIDLTGDTPGTVLLLAAIVIASLYGLLAAPQWLVRCLLRPYWLVPRREWSTLVTNAFVHADLAHLLFNVITLWAFAFGLEAHIGTGRFLALYAFGLLVSDAGTWIRHRDDPDYRCLGASGAILAVLFASIVYFPSASIYILPLPFPVPAPVFAVLYLAYSWYASRHMRGGVNHDAHLSGAVAGLVFVALTDGAALVNAWQSIGGMFGGGTSS